MARLITEKLVDPKWWGEQWAHSLMGGAASSLACAAAVPDPSHALNWYMIGALIGSLSGYIREVAQNWGDDPATNDVVDSNFDSLAFTLGSFVSSFSWLLIRGH